MIYLFFVTNNLQADWGNLVLAGKPVKEKVNYLPPLKTLNYPDPGRPLKKNNPKKLLTDNEFINDEKDPNRTIKEEIIYSFEDYKLFPEEQKECHKEFRGTDELSIYVSICLSLYIFM